MYNIYSGIYDIAEENLAETGRKFSVSKESFLELSTVHPQNGNVFLLSKESNNKTFMEKVYIHLLKRFADASANRNWEGRFSLRSDEFQWLVITTLLKSAEFAGADVRAFDNIYSLHNEYKGRLSETEMAMDVKKAQRRMFIYNILRKIYNKFPECIKKILRKMLAKWR